ncbi:MAG: ABC transporter permease [Bryobacteraceae bacterium]
MFFRFFKRRSQHQNIEDEFEAHLALESQLLQERGLTREEAESRARRSFGNRSLIAEKTREAWVWTWLDRLSQDLKYAARTLRRHTAFTPAVILSIALGVGAGTAVYSIADSVFFRPLPYFQSERLMWVAVTFSEFRMEFLGSADYVAWRRDNHVFESLAATQAAPALPMLLNGENAAEVQDVSVSANFLRTLGIQPELGRDFLSAEELPNGPKSVLLTDHLWQQRFHADSHILGERIQLEGETYTVIGVLPRSFVFPRDMTVDVLTTLPVNLDPRLAGLFAWHVYGRLKPGITLTEARSDLERLFARSKAADPFAYRPGARLIFEMLQQHRVGDARTLLSVLIGAVTCLLLITCANVANLLLARWAARSGELALRAAIGAGRARLARQLLTEAALLALPGCGLAALLAFAILRGFVHYAANELPRMNEVSFDGRVLLIGACVSLVTTLVFGGWPALRAGRTNIQRVLQQSERPGLAASYRFTKRMLVAGEMALCLILLSGAALVLQTLWHLRNDRLGFLPEHILSLSIPVRGTKLDSPADRQALVNDLMTFIRRIPGVEAVAQSDCTPLSGGVMLGAFTRSDRPAIEVRRVSDVVHVCGTTPSYTAAAGIRILRGRFFTEDDNHHPLTFAVINETAARTYFPGESPIGKQILGGIRSPDGQLSNWKTVVGVVSDFKNAGLNAPPAPEAFVNGLMFPNAPKLSLVIHALGNRQALESAISAKLHTIDRGLIADFHPLSETIAEMSGGARFNAILVGGFALIAFLIAVIGVYGVLAFSVAQRTQEIGIRLALGSSTQRIQNLLLREGITPVFIGVAIGTLTVLALTKYLKALLYGVSATDPSTFLCVIFALTIAAIIAISIPAYRAARLDPTAALRHQ